MASNHPYHGQNYNPYQQQPPQHQFQQQHLDQIHTDPSQLTSNYPPPRHLTSSSASSPTASDYESPTLLPRYTSTGRQPTNHIQPHSPGSRPYAPHPLSHATYADSGPTSSESQNGPSINTPTSGSAKSFEKSSGPDSHNGYHPAPTNVSNSALNASDYSLSSRSANAYPTNRRELVHYGPMARLHRAWTGASVGDSGIDERHVKKKRLGYLDGLKFLAAMIVLNGTLFDAVLTENDYKMIQRGSPLYIFRSTNLGISMLLLLSGRCLIAPLWDAPNPQAKFSKNQSPTKPLVSWARLTRAMLIRPFRFLLPVVAVAALQWRLASGGDDRATRKCNEAGMTEPYWSNIDRFAGLVTLLFDLFTYFEQDTVAGKAFGANLWTVPWFFQASYAVYVIHFMLGNLSSNRYWVYGILMLFSWTSLNYFAIPITGLFIADMAAHGQTAKLRKMPIAMKLAFRIGLLTIALCTQWIGVVRSNLNSVMATINVQSHKEIAFADWVFVTVILLIVETSEVAQLILSNIVFRVLSKMTAGLYLLAPAIVFTIVPSVALKLHDSQVYQASGVLGLSWLILIGVAMAGSIAFYLFIECPSKLIGELLVDWVEKLGVDRELMKKDAEDLKALKAEGK
ncbi:hypothetical protein BY996DRAFT_4578843 [Phakopsora pachyrhizi]|nr:hypothetical protein BY996DRAFT_4578843 [Phakopsora pachyrhizi]